MATDPLFVPDDAMDELRYQCTHLGVDLERYMH
jgi:hypothetical protein